DKNFGSKTLNLAASEAAGEQSPESRFLGVYCLGAIDNLPKVVEALGDSKDNRLEKCNAAYDVLKCWIGRQGPNDLKLYEVLLKPYKENDADTVMQLLHGLSADQTPNPEPWNRLIHQPLHSKPAIVSLRY